RGEDVRISPCPLCAARSSLQPRMASEYEEMVDDRAAAAFAATAGATATGLPARSATALPATAAAFRLFPATKAATQSSRVGLGSGHCWGALHFVLRLAHRRVDWVWCLC